MEAKRVSVMILPFVIFTTVSEAIVFPVGFVPTGAGTAGKYYHADNESRNWNESIAYCKARGYLLATKLIKDDVDMLKMKHNTTTFTGTHWISATSREGPGPLAWDLATGAPFKNNFGIPWRASSPLCGAFYSAGAASYFRTLSCSLKYKTLCEQSIP